MKAVVINHYGSPDVFEIIDMPVPEIKAHEILVKVDAASVNPIDWKTRRGNLRFVLGSHFPIVLGYDAAGVVAKTGEKVSRVKPGDMVFGRLDKKYGRSYAEYAVGTENVISIKPASMSIEEAAAIPLAALTALQALRDKAKIKKGDSVLVNGASGGVGHFALQLARYFGGISTAVCSSNHQQMMNDLKPDYFIDYTKSDFKKQPEKYDIILDTAGRETFLSCRHILKNGGTFITLLPRPKVLVHKLIAIFTRGKKVKTFVMKSNHHDLDLVSELYNQGKFKVYIDKVFPLENTADAHEYSEKGHTEGKLVIKINK